MTIYDKLIAAKEEKKEDYSGAIMHVVIGAAAQFEKCRAISKSAAEADQHKTFS